MLSTVPSTIPNPAYWDGIAQGLGKRRFDFREFVRHFGLPSRLRLEGVHEALFGALVVFWILSGRRRFARPSPAPVGVGHAAAPDPRGGLRGLLAGPRESR